ncbi:AAA family ATPase [Myceligenerans sp. I2]|uniref:AAA family ATPase n=2 Tax=Myceligenerans indicum TaxID=2593663 RepID=A0ABS1LF35_9MICO|nr:AAA family ATPase [Myceligenerans indicum]
MYGLLDEQAAAARAELSRVLRERPSGAAEAAEREVVASRLRRRAHALETADHALCFGRIDRADGTWLHVGRIGLRPRADADPLLVDWRADAARPFYTATALAPDGLRRRRHLKAAGRTITEVSDEILDGSRPGSQDVVGDGPLVEALSARRTGHMRAAVSTLRFEQDRIVRSPHRGVTVVQGGPGTGKTVVALHRAAYVLYAHERAAAEGVLVLGPNPRFLDYISHVLPSLGENDVLLATCATLTGRSAAPASEGEARSKGEARMAEALADTVRRRQAPSGPLRTPGDLPDLSAAEVAAARARAAGGGLAHNPARAIFKEHVVDTLTDALEREAADALEQVDQEVAAVMGRDVSFLDRIAAADLVRLGHDGAAVGDAREDFDPDAVRAELAADRGLDGAVDVLWPRLDPEELVREVLEADGWEADGWGTGGRGTGGRTGAGRGASDRWTEADVPLLDEASALVDGLPERTFGHIVVDEAQELTPMQWRMVARRCPSRSMTVVGDFAQAGQVSTVRSWGEALADVADEGRTQAWTLTVSYRTTAEILGATRDLLARIAPDQEPSTAVRHGEEPRTVVVHPRSGSGAVASAVAAAVSDDVAAHPGGQVAVICAERRVGELTGRVEGVAQVLPAAAARGLEFDAVVVVAPDEIVAERLGGQRDLYVALTRPTHRLVVVEKSTEKDLG